MGFEIAWRGLALALALGSSVAAAPVYGFKVVHAYPHDPKAFTEGLFFRNGFLYESTGLEGASTVRKEDLASGTVLQERSIAPQYFGEGIVAAGGRLIELTWRSQVGFVYDLKTFKPLSEFHYSGEGWALTSDGRRLIMSDGTPELRFLDPKSLKETGRVRVTYEGRPVARLNELEYVRGEVYANIWMTDLIARINPRTGAVTGWIDLSGLLPTAERAASGADAVLNGIAYDAASDRLFVTGKLWPSLFEIKLVPKPGVAVTLASP